MQRVLARAPRRVLLLAGVCVALAVCLVIALLPEQADRRSASTELVGARAGFSPGGGFPFQTAAQIQADLDAVVRSGTTWVRVDFPWTSVERQQGTYDWGDLDRVTAAVADAGLRVLALPAYTPDWARPDGCETDKCPPRSAADYAAFVAAAAARYDSDRVQAWELWNEPNIPGFWRPTPDVQAYAQLLRQAAAGLRAARPDAFILSAGLAPAESDGVAVAPVAFLEQLYGSGAMAHVDAVAVHPYTGGALPLEPGTERYNTFLQLAQIRDVMVRHGDAHKPVWGTEFGIATGTDPRGTSPARQAAVVEQGFAWLRNGSWPWLQVLLAYSLRDTADAPADWQSNFGLLRHDGTAKPAFHTLSRIARQPLVPAPAPSPPSRSETGQGASPSTSAAAAWRGRRLKFSRPAVEGLLNRPGAAPGRPWQPRARSTS